MPPRVVSAGAPPQRNPSPGQCEVVGVEVDGLELMPLRCGHRGHTRQTAQVGQLRFCAWVVLALDFEMRADHPFLLTHRSLSALA